MIAFTYEVLKKALYARIYTAALQPADLTTSTPTNGTSQ